MKAVIINGNAQETVPCAIESKLVDRVMKVWYNNKANK